MRRLAIALLSAIAFAARPAHAQELGISVGTKAPGGALETLDGKPTDLKQYIGKTPVVFEFWATWCGNCKQLEPTMLAALKKYEGKVEFVGVAVSVNQSAELVKKYAEKHKLPGTILYDRKGYASDAFDVPATSYVVVVGKDGLVKYTGLGGDQQIDAAIKKAL
jgi:thiol-disulfide isomerase/thioredoxin